MNDNDGPDQTGSNGPNQTGSSGPDLILHPIRMRLIIALGSGPATAGELAARLPDIPPATLYRHLNALRHGGILAVAEERRVRGATERRFTLNPGAASLGPQDLANATAEDHQRWFAAFVGGLMGAFGRYIARGDPDFVRDGVGYRELALNLTDAEFVALATAMGQAFLPYLANAPGDGRTPRLFATVIFPVE